MTVSTTNNRVSYAGNGVTTVFSFPNKFLADADLVVLDVLDSTGAETEKTLTTHYTVSGAGDEAGGSVTMLTAPAAGHTLVIYRDPALTQPIDLVNGDPLNVETGVERGLDRSALQIQRVRDLIDRSLRLPDGDTGFTAADLELPSAVDRASKFLAFGADGTPTATAGLAGTVVISPFMETVVDDLTAVAAIGTLGLSDTADAAKGDALIGFKQSALTGAVGRTVHDKLAEQVSVDDFSGADFTAKLTAAVASGASRVIIPPGSYTLTASITVPTSVRVEAAGPLYSVTITKGFNGDMFVLTAAAAALKYLKLAGAGGTYTGRGVYIAGGNDQQIKHCDLDDFNGYALECYGDNAGQGMLCFDTHFRRTTASNPAVKLPTLGTVETNGNRNFTRCRSSGGVMIDMADSASTQVIGGNFSNLSFSSQYSAKAVIVGNRIATLGGAFPVDGADHNITGNSVAGDITLSATTQRCVVGPNTLLDNATVTDNSTATGNDVNDVYNVQNTDITPVWKGSVSDPAIGNGSLTGSVYRNGRLLRVSIKMVAGATTTFGSGSWYFTLPSPFAAFVARHASVGSCHLYDATGNRYPATALMAVASGNIYPVEAASVSPTTPFTWATSDELYLVIDFEIS